MNNKKKEDRLYNLDELKILIENGDLEEIEWQKKEWSRRMLDKYNNTKR
jgi:hypothetical protein